MANYPADDVTIVRNLVQYGVLKLTEAQRLYQAYTLLCSVERLPSTPAFNYKYPYRKGFYGYCQLCNDNTVIAEYPLTYEQQLVFQEIRKTEFHYLQQQCSLWQYYDNLYENLQKPVIGPTKVSKPVFFLTKIPWDRIRFKLDGNCTVVAKLLCNSYANDCNFIIGSSANPLDYSGFQDIPSVPQNPNKPSEDLPSAPYDPSNGDNGETYVPSGAAQPNWYAVYTVVFGYPNCNQNNGEFRYKLPGATDQNIVPYLANVRTNSTCSNSKDAETMYNGQVLDTPRGYLTMRFEYGYA